MRWLRLLLCATALLLWAEVSRAGELSDHFVTERADGLWGRIGPNGAPELLSDKAHYEKVEHHGEPCYVLLRFDEQRSWIKILECDASGGLRRIRTIADENVACATAILAASFLPDDRLAVLLHVNPTVSVAVTVDLETNRRRVLTGNAFTQDASGLHVAYARDSSDSPR
ncbi:MAG TPA: hypothetical protein VG269_16970 [Tepidisphaeraceae bacterium]|jgi:hypothetical protein|nr:hypothetical protein [Tepidisphaeraceae bacterium]